MAVMEHTSHPDIALQRAHALLDALEQEDSHAAALDRLYPEAAPHRRDTAAMLLLGTATHHVRTLLSMVESEVTS